MCIHATEGTEGISTGAHEPNDGDSSDHHQHSGLDDAIHRKSCSVGHQHGHMLLGCSVHIWNRIAVKFTVTGKRRCLLEGYSCLTGSTLLSEHTEVHSGDEEGTIRNRARDDWTAEPRGRAEAIIHMPMLEI